MGNERRQRRERGDEEKKGEGEEERGDTVASRTCQSILSVPADKTNLGEYSSKSNAMHLKIQFFGPISIYLVSLAGPGRSSCSAERS